jgi:hypothetical protein
VRCEVGREGLAFSPFRALRRTDGFGAALKMRAHSSLDVAMTSKVFRSGR